MKQTIIKIENQKLLNELEALHFEVQGRKNVIHFILNSDDLNLEASAFDSYHKDYIKYFKLYEEKKEEFANYYNLNNYEENAIWNVDFIKKELVITHND